MNRKKFIFSVLIIAIAGMAIYFMMSGKKGGLQPRLAQLPVLDPISEASSTEFANVPLVIPYENKAYHFTLKMPEGFKVRELGVVDGAGDTIVIEDTKGNGVQVTVSSYDDVKELTVADIERDIPDLKIINPQVVGVGPENKGVAFLSDNQAFGGASREVWFVFKGNLYQISTYARLDNLLKGVFSTWDFK